jgi:hypothetical protein
MSDNSERSTTELIETLGNDVDRCHQELIELLSTSPPGPDGSIEVEYEHLSRQLIRAIFAFFEAVTFSVKMRAIEELIKSGHEVLWAERYLAADIEFTLTDKGEVTERPARIRLVDNIRFAFSLQERFLGITDRFDPSCKWWGCLKTAIKIRDRITHPKFPEDIDVSPEETIVALDAYNGFKKHLVDYSLMQKERKKVPV